MWYIRVTHLVMNLNTHFDQIGYFNMWPPIIYRAYVSTFENTLSETIDDKLSNFMRDMNLSNSGHMNFSLNIHL